MDPLLAEAGAPLIKWMRIAFEAREQASRTNPVAKLYPATAGVSLPNDADGRQRAALQAYGVDRIQRKRHAFEVDRDPLAPWQAMLIAGITLNDVPEWAIDEVIIKGGQRIESLTESAPQDFALAVGRALGFVSARGVESPFRRSQRYHRDVEVATSVYGLMTSVDAKGHTDELKNAVADVAKMKGLSEATVRRAWNKNKDRLNELIAGNPPIS